jgi:hypothetical protein
MEPQMPATGPIATALNEALRTAPLLPRDSAGVELAKRYAALLDAALGDEDEAKVTADLGPKLKDLLTALGMTPAGRANKKETTDGPVPGSDELARLRAEKRARANGA